MDFHHEVTAKSHKSIKAGFAEVAPRACLLGDSTSSLAAQATLLSQAQLPPADASEESERSQS